MADAASLGSLGTTYVEARVDVSKLPGDLKNAKQQVDAQLQAVSSDAATKATASWEGAIKQAAQTATQAAGPVGELGERVTQASSAFEAASASGAAMAVVAGGALAAITAAIVVGRSLAEFTAQAAAAGQQLSELSQKSGIAVEPLATLGTAAVAAGSDLKGLISTSDSFQQRIVSNTDNVRSALRQLGLDLDVLQSKDRAEQMLELSDAFRALPDGVNKTAVAIELLGSSGANSLPLLLSPLRDLDEAAQRLGITFSTQTADAARHLNAETTLLGDALASVENKIGGQILQLLDGFVSKLLASGGAAEILFRSLNLIVDIANPIIAFIAHQAWLEWTGVLDKAGLSIKSQVDSLRAYLSVLALIPGQTETALAAFKLLDEVTRPQQREGVPLDDETEARLKAEALKKSVADLDAQLEAHKAVLDGLTAAQRAHIAQEIAEDATAQQLSKTYGISVKQAQDLIQSYKDAQKEAAKFEKAQDDIAASSSRIAVEDKAAIASLIERGKSLQDISRIYGYTVTELEEYKKELQEAAKAEREAATQDEKDVKAQTKAIAESIEQRAAGIEQIRHLEAVDAEASLDSSHDVADAYQKKVEAIDEWATQTKAAFKGAGKDIQEYYDLVDSIAEKRKEAAEPTPPTDKRSTTDLDRLTDGLHALGNAGIGAASGIASAIQTAKHSWGDVDATFAGWANKLESAVAAGVQLSHALGGGALGNIAGGALTGANIGSALPIPGGGLIGAGIGAAVGGIASLFNIGSAGRDLVVQFADAQGGFENLWAELAKGGDEGDALWRKLSSVGSNNADQAKQVIGEVTDFLQKQTQAEQDAAAAAQQAAADRVTALTVLEGATNKLTANLDGTQASFDRVSRIALASFNTIIASGASPAEAIQTIGSAVDDLSKDLDKNKLSSNGAFQQLSRWRDLATANQPILDQITSLNALLMASDTLGSLTADTFKDIEDQGVAAYKQLTDAGFTQQEAEAAEAPLLQQILKLHKEKGLAIDDETQKIIDQAEQDGQLSDQQESEQDILKEGLGAIIKLLGGDIPDAWKKMADSASDQMDRVGQKADDTAKGVQASFDGIHIDWPAPGPPTRGGDDGSGGGTTPAPLGFTGDGGSTGILPFADGGIVVDPMIGLLGEAGPEAVIPLPDFSALAAAAGGGAARGVTVHVALTLENNITALDADSLMRVVPEFTAKVVTAINGSGELKTALVNGTVVPMLEQLGLA